MGDLLKAVCQCGYESDLLNIGVGFSFPETGHVFTVAYCNQCKNVQSVDDAGEPPLCETCNQQLTYYEVEFRKLRPGCEPYEAIVGERWYCPVCKTHSLHFEWSGLWD